MAAVGMAGSALNVRVGSRSGLAGARLPAAPRPAMRQAARRQAVVMRGTSVQDSKGYPSNWLRADPLVFVLGFLGWTIPTTFGVPIFNGGSFFGNFLAQIGENLARFPQGPPLSSPFWLYLTVYHAGLFATLFFGQIGVQGRKQGYWG